MNKHKIDKLRIYWLRNSEKKGFGLALKNILSDFPLEEMGIKKQANKYSQVFILFSELKKVRTRQVLTKEVKKLDRERKKAGGNLKRGLLVFLDVFDKKVASAAKRLYVNVLKRGWDFNTQDYISESRTVNLIISDFNTSEGKKDVETTGIGHLVKELHEKNEAFNEVFHKREDNKNTEKKKEIKDIDKQFLDAYYKLVNSIEVMADEYDYNPSFVKLIVNINLLITNYNSIIKSRKTRKK